MLLMTAWLACRDVDAVSIASGASMASEPVLMSRAASVPDLAGRLRLPIKCAALLLALISIPYVARLRQQRFQAGLAEQHHAELQIWPDAERCVPM